MINSQWETFKGYFMCLKESIQREGCFVIYHDEYGPQEFIQITVTDKVIEIEFSNECNEFRRADKAQDIIRLINNLYICRKINSLPHGLIPKGWSLPDFIREDYIRVRGDDFENSN